MYQDVPDSPLKVETRVPNPVGTTSETAGQEGADLPLSRAITGA
jgi:hypothetical protein